MGASKGWRGAKLTCHHSAVEVHCRAMLVQRAHIHFLLPFGWLLAVGFVRQLAQ